MVVEVVEERSEYQGHNCMASCPARMYRLTPLSPEESAAVRVAALSLPSSSGELWIVMILEIEIRVRKTLHTERERERERERGQTVRLTPRTRSCSPSKV